MTDLKDLEYDNKTLEPISKDASSDALASKDSKSEERPEKTVPYSRLKEEIRSKQEAYKLIDDLKSEVQSIKQQVASGRKVDTSQMNPNSWDYKVSNAKSWDDVFSDMPKTMIEAILNSPDLQEKLSGVIESRQSQRLSTAEQQIDQELTDLKDREIVTTKDEENKLIAFAIEKSEKLGKYIPLDVAHDMMVSSGKWGNKTEDRSEANRKVRSGREGADKLVNPKDSYKAWSHQSLDDVISHEVSKLSKS